jgi:hypothetical protein
VLVVLSIKWPMVVELFGPLVEGLWETMSGNRGKGEGRLTVMSTWPGVPGGLGWS